jgi:RNA polymerase sigma-70 factor (ECF subfamily)
MVATRKWAITERAITRKQDIRSDDALARGFLAGDNDAFHELFRRHNGRLLAYCAKFVRDVPLAEDLTQETWVRSIDLRDTSRGDEVQNLLGLLFRIARNLCLDALKSPRIAARQSLHELDERGHPTAEGIREMTSEEEIVLRALDRLPIEYRETLVLHIYCGYGYEEIATMQGKTPDAIWARASRGRKKLREMVSEELRREEGALRIITGRETTERKRGGAA